MEMSFAVNIVKSLIDDYGQMFGKNIFIHSDQDSHYTNLSFQQCSKENGITQSMSKRGNCWDKAPRESFFGHGKDEMNLNETHSFYELEVEIEYHIDNYNNGRPQLLMSRITPYEYHQYLTNSNAQSL